MQPTRSPSPGHTQKSPGVLQDVRDANWVFENGKVALVLYYTASSFCLCIQTRRLAAAAVWAAAALWRSRRNSSSSTLSIRVIIRPYSAAGCFLCLGRVWTGHALQLVLHLETDRLGASHNNVHVKIPTSTGLLKCIRDRD